MELNNLIQMVDIITQYESNQLPNYIKTIFETKDKLYQSRVQEFHLQKADIDSKLSQISSCIYRLYNEIISNIDEIGKDDYEVYADPLEFKPRSEIQIVAEQLNNANMTFGDALSMGSSQDDSLGSLDLSRIESSLDVSRDYNSDNESSLSSFDLSFEE